MAFEDLQTAFIEAHLEELREKNNKLKSKDKAKSAKSKKVVKNKKKISTDKKPGLVKSSAKIKNKALSKPKVKELESKKKTKDDKNYVKDKKEEKDDDKAVANLPTDDKALINQQIDISIYQQKFYLPEDKDRVSGPDQLEAISKLPLPQDKLPAREEKRLTVQNEPSKLQDKHQTPEDRAKLIRKSLGMSAYKSAITPSKTPITAEVKAMKEAASKAVSSMNAILALHNDKKT